MLAACEGCPNVPASGWSWVSPEVGYVVANDVPGQAPDGRLYRLTPDGSYTYLADPDTDGYDYLAGVSLLDDDTLLGFFINASRRGGMFMRAVDANPMDSWTHIGGDLPPITPVPGPVVDHRWANGEYELIVE